MSTLIDISKIQPKVSNVTFIAIDGHGGSGKSTLAKYLSKQLGAQVIHTDDFASWDNVYDWRKIVIEKVFKRIESGEKMLSYDRSKWWENHNPKPVVNQPVTSIMILEGVSSMREEFDSYISLRIFVDTPIDVCLKRGIERDMKTGKSESEVKKLWNEWLQEEEEHYSKEPPKQKADVILDGTQSFEEQIVLKY